MKTLLLIVTFAISGCATWTPEQSAAFSQSLRYAGNSMMYNQQISQPRRTSCYQTAIGFSCNSY